MMRCTRGAAVLPGSVGACSRSVVPSSLVEELDQRGRASSSSGTLRKRPSMMIDDLGRRFRLRREDESREAELSGRAQGRLHLAHRLLPAVEAAIARIEVLFVGQDVGHGPVARPCRLPGFSSEVAAVTDIPRKMRLLTSRICGPGSRFGSTKLIMSGSSTSRAKLPRASNMPGVIQLASLRPAGDGRRIEQHLPELAA